MEHDEDLRKTLSRVYELQLHTPSVSEFSGAMLDIEHLMNCADETPYEGKHIQLLYACIIAALEAFLYDTLVSQVFKYDTVKIGLLEKADIFKNEKYTLAEIYSDRFDINLLIHDKLNTISWHNLSRIEKYYEAAFNVSFPADRDLLHRAILLRHDIVHRNGKKNDGTDIFVSKNQLRELIQSAEKFVIELNGNILNKIKGVQAGI